MLFKKCIILSLFILLKIVIIVTISVDISQNINNLLLIIVCNFLLFFCDISHKFIVVFMVLKEISWLIVLK